MINLNYKREGIDLEVEVIGIPANVCTRCFYRVIPGKVAKYMTLLIYSDINIASIIVFGGSKIVNLRNKATIYSQKCAIRSIGSRFL